MLYRFFKKHASDPVIATAAYAGWFARCRWRARRCPAERPSYSKGRAPVRVGVICDQMTFDEFRQECRAVFITPQNWRAVLLETPPDFLLCESAWHGTAGSGGCWRGRIYRNHSVAFEHRRALFDILEACKRRGIPTVFWNKEDPAFFGSRQYDFVDTALRFDHIFTTAEECVPQYQALGHRHVHLLRFGFSPGLFNPLGSGGMKREAFFAGSWYQDQPERCRDMERLFQYAEDNGIPCTIYDRNYGARETLNRFPEKYRDKIRPPVPFTGLSGITKQYLYALNVNTVRSSETMFARRVYEMMAENHIVISNRSKGLEREFPDSVWYCDQDSFPADIPGMRRKNLEHVFRFHTCERRLETILQALGMTALKPPVRLYVFSAGGKHAEALQEPDFPGIRIEHRKFDGPPGPGETEALRQDDYAVVLRGDVAGRQVKWDFLLAQFSYLPADCGVRRGRAAYEIVEDEDNWNCVFPVSVLGTGLEHFSERLKKLEL